MARIERENEDPMNEPPNHDEILTQLGRRFGDLLAEACVLDPPPTRADAMLAMRSILEGLRERIPVGENTTADQLVEYVALNLRLQWGAPSEPGVPITIIDPPTPRADPTQDQIDGANDLLASIPLERRIRLLQGVHFCWTCGADTSDGSCGCADTGPRGKGPPE